MNEEEKKLCEARVVAHRPTVQKFRAIISDAIGNLKKIAKNTYLRLLGYHTASKPSSAKETRDQQLCRTREKETYLERCVKTNDAGSIDAHHWRTAAWSDLSLDPMEIDVVAVMEEGEKLQEEMGVVDNWFLNEASRRTLLDLQGWHMSEGRGDFMCDASLLTLARADAAMPSMLKMITVGGRGGVTNNGFVESFRALLLVAMENIIKELWLDISEKAEHVFAPFIGNSREVTSVLLNFNVKFKYHSVLHFPKYSLDLTLLL